MTGLALTNRRELPAAAKVEVSTDVREAEWDAFVIAQPSATGYHRWAWRRVFERAFCHETRYLAAREHDRITGVLPLVILDSWLFGRFVVSLPFVNYGGVLATGSEVATALVDAAVAVGRQHRAAYVELRHAERQCAHLTPKRHKVAMTLPLPHDAQRLWLALDRKVRNQIRKAEKSRLEASIGGIELLPAFYAVFARNMRDLGTPVYHQRFFQEVLRQFPADAAVCVVKHGDVPVAAAIGLWCGGILEVPWAGSLRTHRSSCPNQLLYWTMLQHAISRGCSTFDFGRSTPGGGTFDFKRQWGAVPHELCWEYALLSKRELPDLNPANPKYGSAIAIWKRLPVSLTTWVGPAIVRSIP